MAQHNNSYFRDIHAHVSHCVTRLFPQSLCSLNMPQPPPVLCSRHTYSTDLWECVIYQKYTLGSKVADISTSLNMSWHTVKHILNLWGMTGKVSPSVPGRTKERCRIMDTEEIEVHFHL